MVTEIDTKVRLNKDGTIRKKYPSKHGPAFGLRMNIALSNKIKSLPNWQDWVRETLEKAVNEILDNKEKV